jgi:hypothetical protein
MGTRVPPDEGFPMAAFLARPDGLQWDSPSWSQPPRVVHALVLHLLAVIRQHTARRGPLEARLAIREAERQRHSSHANRPPSTDPPWVKPPHPGKPPGTPGARAGHPGPRQILLEPPEVIEVQPPACGCGQTGFPEMI